LENIVSELYTYAKLCNTNRLIAEIHDSTIVTALDYINTLDSPERTDIYFKEALSEPDETTLDTIVDEHINEPLADDSVRSMQMYSKVGSLLIPSPATDDGRMLQATNRVPGGYSLYITGEADNIASGTYGGGTALQFDSSNTTKDFQLLNHFYAIGARVNWEGCSIANYFNATLVAPATTGLTNTTGDFNKYAVTGGNLIIPAPPGAGAWSMDLTAKLTNTQILKAVPIPAAGNNGWFDYNSTLNELTVNSEQTGGYNLFDFEINLHSFGRKIWAQSGAGQSSMDVTDLVGKLLYNSWKIRLSFYLYNGVLQPAQKASVVFVTCAKGNISPA
jgi:hypothetical protein